MSRKSLFLTVLIATLASGCAHVRSNTAPSVQASVAPEGVPSDWRRVAQDEDAAKLDGVAAIWTQALAEASKTDARSVAAEGALLRGNAALSRPMPTPGLYRCRALRLGGAANGAKAPAFRPFTRFKSFDCVISPEATLLGFTKVSGTHRPGGYLWPDSDRRMIFLGGTAERDGEAASAYGAQPVRNRIGTFERIAEFRWRLVLLGNGSEQRLEVIELVPAVAVPVQGRS